MASNTNTAMGSLIDALKSRPEIIGMLIVVGGFLYHMEVTESRAIAAQERRDGRVALGPLDGTQSVHADADELSFAELIGHAVTEEEEGAIVAAITEAKGGSIRILDLIEASPSLSSNLRTREQLDDDGWFSSDEV